LALLLGAPAPKPKEERKMNAHEIAQLLRDRQRPFSPKEVQRVVLELGLEGEVDIEALTREVLEEGRKWTMGVLAGLWDVLKVPPPPGVEEELRQGGRVQVSYAAPEDGEEGYLWVVVTNPKRRPDGGIDLPSPELPTEYLFFEASTGFAGMRTDHLHVRREGAFFRGEEGDLGKALKEAKALRPVLSAMGLGDLEGALEKLAELGEGEVRAEGPYVLARGGGVWALRRGTVLGDLHLDGAFLLGEEVKAPLGEAEVVLKPKWFWGVVGLEYVRFRLGEEEVSLRDEGDDASAEERDPIGRILQQRLKRELARVEEMRESPLSEASPGMMSLLKALAQRQEPFWELTGEGLRTPANPERHLEM
jgi:hypothetical protein